MQVAGPQARLLAAGSTLDFDDHALLVVGVALDHREAYLLLELLDAGPCRLQVRAELGVLAHLGDQFLRARGVILGAPPFGGELRGGLDLTVVAAGLRVAFAVGDDGGVRHLLAELGEAGFDLLDEPSITGASLGVRPEQVVRAVDGCFSPDGLVWSSMVVGP